MTVDLRLHSTVSSTLSNSKLDFSGLKFDPSNTFDCGQVFRWKPTTEWGNEWVGVVGTSVVAVTRKDARIISRKGTLTKYENEKIANYLSADCDLDSALRTLPHDEFLKASISEFPGLRLLCQDPWECIVSFVCSINKNIPAIRLSIENLCARFGKPIESDKGIFHSFPTPDALANSKKEELLKCKVGFRWKYIKFIAMKVCSNELDLEQIKKINYDQARKMLVSKLSGLTFGVGPKVSDCVLLFSLDKTEAFPIDIWMIRCVKQHYAKLLDIDTSLLERESLSLKSYDSVSKKLRQYFGKYAGYAQQYLYMKTRSDYLHSR